ncbi:hypothetical protein [Treponema bryantii]|uniref:hypothetical protein n=1 Tax=Treponema bryantii TaxID=163 RepID=UPI0003B60826|nr:hypothetical protein [Treponema bryantii]
MKKIKFLGTAILAASLLFAGCSSPVEDVVAEEDTSVSLSPEETGSNSGTTNGGTTTGGNTTGGNSNGGSTGGNTNRTIPNTGVYWEYLVGTRDGAIDAFKYFQDWGNGSRYTDNPDGSITVTAGTNWGAPRVNLAYGDIPAGYFSRFDRVVAYVDESNFQASNAVILFAGSGDESITVTPIEKDGLSVYVVDISESTKAATSKQIALQLFGTGSVTVKSWYLEADSEIEVFRTPLVDLITAATEFKDNAIVGTSGGQYPQTSYEAFADAIETANAVNDNSSSTQSEIYAAIYALSEAKVEFEAAKLPLLPFESLSEFEIPEGATVLFKADDAANSVLTPNNNPWYVPEGGKFVIKADNFSATEKVYEIITKGDNACGCFNLNVQVTAGQKLYVSCYSEKNTSIKPVAPDAETLITGSNEWQLIEVEYSEGALLHQLGVVGKTAEENSLFIDAIYIN